MIVVLVYQFGLRYVLSYRLTDEDVRAVLFGVVPLSVRRYEFITEVYTASFLEMQFAWVWPVQNRLTGRGRVSFGGVTRSLVSVPFINSPATPEGFARK